MGRLDELDLSKSLSRKEEARGLDRAWERLAQLRLGEVVSPSVAVHFGQHRPADVGQHERALRGAADENRRLAEVEAGAAQRTLDQYVELSQTA